MIKSLSLVFLAVTACGPGERTDVGAPDAGTPTHDAAPTQPPLHDAAQAVCYEPSVTGTVTAGVAHIQQCALWSNADSLQGSVTLTRAGSDLTMAFANGITFTGSVVATHVTLTYSQLHYFDDGCEWRATETLTGTLDPTSCVMTVAYSYVETIAISNGACAIPCTGSANLSLQIAPIF